MHTLTATSDLSVYLSETTRYPLLSKEDEFDLAVKFRKTGDREAAHRLVTSNLRFVVKIAYEYRNYGLKIMDIIQEGNIGLMMAVKKFDPYKGYRLITYAVWWIRAYMQEFIIKNWSIVKIGTTQAQKKLFYKLRKAQEDIGDETDYKAIAKNLDVKEVEVEEMDLRLSGRDYSLDASIAEEGETAHIERLTYDGPNHEDVIVESHEKAFVKEKVDEVVSRMPERDRFIIEKRLMADESMTLQEIGDHLGVSRERARQLEARIKKNLRSSLCQKQLTWNS